VCFDFFAAGCFCPSLLADAFCVKKDNYIFKNEFSVTILYKYIHHLIFYTLFWKDVHGFLSYNVYYGLWSLVNIDVNVRNYCIAPRSYVDVQYCV
jgi:hypothetical protein